MDNSNGKFNLNHDYQIKINVIDFPFILALILIEIKYVWGADIKIMDRFFRHRELPDSENFSKPGFHPKMA